jgi:hypothetical protein
MIQDGDIDPLVSNVLAIGGKNHLNIFLSLQANSSGGQTNAQIHYKTLCLGQGKDTSRLRFPATMGPYTAKN